MLRWTTILALAVVAATPAAATGGFSCTVDDKNLSLEAESPLGRGMGSPIIKLAAKAKIKLKDTPKDFTEIDLNDALVHSWLADQDLNLHFYREREGDTPFGSVELVIKTKTTAEADEEGGTKGTYKLSVFFTEAPATPSEPKQLEASGTVSCFVE